MTEPGKADLVDLHSHLVPGVDDGARSIEDVLEGIGRMVEQGVRTIVTTPHLDGSLTNVPGLLDQVLGSVDEAWELVRQEVARSRPGLDFRRGHEILLDVPDPDLSDPRIRLGESRVVLVEWPGLQIPPETPRVLGELGGRGAQILIAHPERYRGLDQDLSLPYLWKEEGAWLQMNFGSLVGRYGPAVRRVALRFLETGMIDCLSTDFHGRPHLPLYIEEARTVFEKLEAEEAWTVLTSINPGRIIEGEPPLPVPPVTVPRGFLSRIIELFDHLR